MVPLYLKYKQDGSDNSNIIIWTFKKPLHKQHYHALYTR